MEWIPIDLLKGYFKNFKPVKLVLKGTFSLTLLGTNSELFKSKGKHCLIFNCVFLIWILSIWFRFSFSLVTDKLFKNNGIGEL